MPAFTVRPLTPDDAEAVRAFTRRRWGDEIVVGHGTVYCPHTLPGFVAADESGEWVGLLTYQVDGDALEVVTIDSLHQGQGIGTALMDAAEDAARAAACRALWLITTNDNLNALRFYQKRGLRMVAVYPDAVNESRKIKPAIPLVGAFGIPLCDELRLEKRL